MPDPVQIPDDADYIFVKSPLTKDALKAILDGMESTANQHPVD